MDNCYYGSLKSEYELKKSSSGGFAASIAKYVVNQKGIVYGVAYTSDFKGAEFIRATTEEEIRRLAGSKYINANNAKIRLGGGGGIIDDLRSNRMVVFFGLPCNIAALLAFLKKEDISTINLITIDLVCGGVTPSEVEEQYVEYLEKKYKSKMTDFSVRYKNPNWIPPYLRAEFENGKVICKEFYETEFGYAFEHMKKEGCYSCKLKGDNHLSDITIGDGWGIEEKDIGYNTGGVSVAFVHTQVGDQLMKSLSDIELYEADSERMKQSNPRYLSPKPRLQTNEQFRDNYQKLGLINACKKTYGLKKRLILAMPDRLLTFLRKIKQIVGK